MTRGLPLFRLLYCKERPTYGKFGRHKSMKTCGQDGKISVCRRRMSGSGASGSGRQLQSTVLGSYKAELREFRALQEELQPWTDAFKEQHKRKPTLADVQATREGPLPPSL